MTRRNFVFVGWVWTENEEIYSSVFFDSRQDAINEAKKDSDLDFVYVGKAFKPDGIEFFPDADDLIGIVRDNLDNSDAGGEWSENWLETCKQARNRVSDQDIARLDFALKEVFGKWMDETGNRPDFYTVDDVEKVKISQEEENGAV